MFPGGKLHSPLDRTSVHLHKKWIRTALARAAVPHPERIMNGFRAIPGFPYHDGGIKLVSGIHNFWPSRLGQQSCLCQGLNQGLYDILHFIQRHGISS